MRIRFLFLLFVFIQSHLLLSAQSKKGYTDKYFRSISVSQGLSQNTVFAIAQDSLGFIWIGTQYGLNRFNGETFKIYKPDNSNKNSLQSDYVRSLLLDKKGLLWIGGNKGISSYDQNQEKFKNYLLPVQAGEWLVTSITYDNEDKIWASTSFGDLYYLDRKTDKFVRVTLPNIGQENFVIRQILFHDNLLYLATDFGLRIIDLKSKKILSSGLNNIQAEANCLLLNKYQLWIGTEGDGVYQYNLQTKQLTNYRHKIGDNTTLVDNNIRSIEKDDDGNLWIGTFNGLSVLNLQTDIFKNYLHDPTNSYTISQNSVRYIFRDHQGGMWIGTYYGGVNYYHKDDIKFNLMDQFTKPLLLNDQVVNVIKEDPYGNIWIGANDRGLNIWNRANNSISYLSHEETRTNTISSDNIKAIEFDQNGNALIGTHNSGLNLIDKNTGKITYFYHDSKNPSSIAGNMVYALTKDHKNRIWVGTFSGLDQFHPGTNTFTHYYIDKLGQRLTSDQITFLQEDSKKRIWIGTTNGVNIFYPESGKFEVFKDNSITNNRVSGIVEDKWGRIWIGAREGLSYFDEGRRTFVRYFIKDNLTRDIVYSLRADNEGNLWVAVTKGLIKINHRQKKVEFFDNRNGLGKNQFDLTASCKTKDGMLLFGGINGLSYFYPQNIVQKPYQLNIKFTGLDVLNTPVTPFDNNKIIKNHINNATEIRLPYDYKQFTIYFSTFNYIAPNKIDYYYKLEGFDSDWQKCEGSPKASYSNLYTGNYNLLVKAVGPLGETSIERSLKIKVSPPWWTSNWFFLTMLIILSSGGYFAYVIIADRLKTRRQLKAERIDREKLEYVNNMKMEFFTNISHEFKTPLTLLIAPLEEMTRHDSFDGKSTKKNLKLMLANTKRLYRLVDQLLEFRKTELGTRKLRVRAEDMVGFLNEIYSMFLELSKKNNIKYSFHSSEPKLVCTFDRDALEKIMVNLLSNAFKHTKADGFVKIELEKSDNDIIIKVHDSGIGISPENLQKVFERFYQVDHTREVSGSGVGLAFTKSLIALHHGTISVESVVEMGTTFIVKLPIDSDKYLPEEYLDTTENGEHNTIFNGSNEPLASESEHPSIPEVQEETISSTQKESILIVDDNYEIVDYLASYFGKNYRIYTAGNGAQALSLLEETPIDLILSDIMMPEMDGISFCKKIKKNINTSHVPVILLTAKGETEHQIKGLEVGADDYVTKPFSTSLLEAKVQNILRSRKRLKEYYSQSRDVIPENIALNDFDKEFLDKAIAIIANNLTDPDFSVSKLSEEIGMSRSNLYLKLKAITDESTIDFIKRIRFKKALELLESKRYSVSQIAYMSGFNSPSYFSTAFKQYYGYLPSDHFAKDENTSNLQKEKTE